MQRENRIKIKQNRKSKNLVKVPKGNIGVVGKPKVEEREESRRNI